MKILIRFDDIAENMNWHLMDKCEKLFDKYEIKINKGTREKLSNFQILINNFINNSKSKDAYEVAEDITKSTGIYGLLYSDKTPEGITRFENIQELLNAIKNFTNSSGNNLNLLSDFIEDIALLTDQDQENEEDFNKVTLMTIDENKSNLVETDASQETLSATLNLEGRPVAFFSRSLNHAQKSYPTVEKEAMADVEAVTHWSHLLRK